MSLVRTKNALKSELLMLSEIMFGHLLTIDIALRTTTRKIAIEFANSLFPKSD